MGGGRGGWLSGLRSRARSCYPYILPKRCNHSLIPFPRCWATGTLEVFRRFVNLTILRLQDCFFISGYLSSLGSLVKLKELNLNRGYNYVAPNVKCLRSIKGSFSFY